MKKYSSSIFLHRLLLALFLLLPCLCTFPATSFNHGKLLLPGETLTTLAYGQRSTFEIKGHDSSYLDTIGYGYNKYIFIPTDTIGFMTPIGVLDYRLGVLAQRPFGKGLEIGFSAEVPLSEEKESWRALILQYDARFGLPMRQFKNAVYHQNIDVGWVVGEWVDNGWFLEYAGGFEHRSMIPYYNVRVTRLATDVMGKSIHDYSYGFGGENFLTYHDRGWNFRMCAGVSYKIPRLPVFPDFIVPELTFYFPNASFKAAGFSWHIGARWHNGF